MFKRKKVIPLTAYEYGVKRMAKIRSPAWLKLNHPQAYKHLLKMNLIKEL